MAEQVSFTSLRAIVKDPALLAAKRRELENLRFEHKREWALNQEFYHGNHWCYWNRHASPQRVENLGVDDGDKPRYVVRLTDNQITDGVQHHVAQMTKTKPTVHATPNSGSDKDVKASQVAEKLYEHLWHELSLKAKLVSALTYADVSQGWWKISWDPLAGTAMEVLLGPDGQPILDEQFADLFREELENAARENGMPPDELLREFEQTVYVGDIRVEALPGPNVLLDPNVKNWEDASYAVCIHHMDPDEVAVRWPKGKNLEPDCVTDEDGAPVLGRLSEERAPNARRVFIWYFRPSPVLPRGRYIVAVEKPDMILAEGDWNFPTHDLPLVKFPGVERVDSALDTPRVSLARPLNKQINKTLSQIVMHQNLTLRPQIMAPRGTLTAQLTNEPGKVVEYDMPNGAVPAWREMPDLPRYVTEQLDRLQGRIDRIFNRMPTERQQLPARIDAGYGIDAIQEAVADQLSPSIERMEAALARAGKLMAALADQYYTEQRFLRIVGANGATKVSKFKHGDLGGGFTYRAVAGSGLPRNRAGKQQQIMQLLEAQLITPGDALKHLDLANLSGISEKLQADEEQALREHDRIMSGTPLNMAAVEDVMQPLSEGINPETGEQLSGDPAEIEYLLERASLMPVAYENSVIHLDTHASYMKSLAYEQLPPEIQRRYRTHYDLTVAKLQAEAPTEPVPIRMNVSQRGTVSAPVMGAMLRKAGVQVTDEQVAEEPLETWVTDSIDKPDQDGAGNDPYTQAEQVQAMQQNAEEHAVKMAEASHRVALAEAKVQSTRQANARTAQDAMQADQVHEQQMVHNHEQHEQQRRQADEAHQDRRAAATRKDE